MKTPAIILMLIVGLSCTAQNPAIKKALLLLNQESIGYNCFNVRTECHKDLSVDTTFIKHYQKYAFMKQNDLTHRPSEHPDRLFVKMFNITIDVCKVVGHYPLCQGGILFLFRFVVGICKGIIFAIDGYGGGGVIVCFQKVRQRIGTGLGSAYMIEVFHRAISQAKKIPQSNAIFTPCQSVIGLRNRNQRGKIATNPKAIR